MAGVEEQADEVQENSSQIPNQNQPLSRTTTTTCTAQYKTPTYCDAHQPPSILRRLICTFIPIFLLLAGVTLLILWLIYRPYNPQFTVVGATIYDLNVSSSLSLLTTTMQFTILTRNPNKKVSIYYDKLSVFVSYRNQAITSHVMLPPLYSHKHCTVALSPVLGSGAPVPVSVEVVNGLIMDERCGVVGLTVVLLGRIRWKAGAIKTGHYGLYVKCDVLVGSKKGFAGQVPLLGSSPCKVDT